ncbi:Hsp20/alpha crystallin family protein [Natrarchaeobius halalkaliphilus]|uniref:Hsp20/alpha crystallin family protein n=1 Tax=Natrarchaeobius halalkaliphilus TaxID=1679091 RepID=A0A3N6P3I6_9EURY|nr:Hsp20/alpha crystallin family protein [Natrarchaeobius halalkaliphilus]RQG89855.1 Hsp20/alpha crystallin family protein [Natrarchaeobius halalkaliphilus]
MTEDDPDVSDDRFDESNDDHWLSSLLAALESLERRSASDVDRRGRSTVEYDLSIRTLDDLLDSGSAFGGDPVASEGFDQRDPAVNDGSDERTNDHRRRRRRRSRSSRSYHLTTRRYDDELVISADVTSADPGEVTVGLDDDAIVIAVDTREIGRVNVPWPEHTTEAAVRNGVLTVRIEPESSAGSAASGTEVDPNEDTEDTDE